MSYYPTLISASVNMDQGDIASYNYILVDATSDDVTILLPSDLYDGLAFQFVRIDDSANNVVVAAQNSKTINSGVSIDLGPAQLTIAVALGANWFAPVHTSDVALS